MLRAIEHYDDPNLTVIQAGSRNLVVTYPDEILYAASLARVRALPDDDRRAGVMA